MLFYLVCATILIARPPVTSQRFKSHVGRTKYENSCGHDANGSGVILAIDVEQERP